MFINMISLLLVSIILLSSDVKVVDCKTNSAQDMERLLDEVKEISAPGTCGGLLVYGANAFPIIVGKFEQKYYLPFIGGARLGKGRIVAFGHNAYLNDPLNDGQTSQFIQNAIDWSANKLNNAILSVAVYKRGKFVEYLKDNSLSAQFINENELNENTLNNYDVLCILAADISDDMIQIINDFINIGGGLLISETGWGWLQTHPNKKLSDNNGNKIISKAGLMFTEVYLDKTDKIGFEATINNLLYSHSDVALDELIANKKGVTSLSQSKYDYLLKIIEITKKDLPLNDLILLPKIIAFEKGNLEEENQDLKFLLNGIHEITAPGASGALSVYGDAFTVVAGKTRDQIISPAIAASRYGSGRIVVFGHTEYLSQDTKSTPTEADMVKFLKNATYWAAGKSLTDNVSLAVYNQPNFVKFLKEHSINCEGLSGIGWTDKLKNFQVLSVVSDRLVESDVKPLIDYLLNGGGILIATTGWGWKEYHNSLSLPDDNLGNKISSGAGIVVTGDYLWPTSKIGFSTELKSNLNITNANKALELLLNNKLTKTEAQIVNKVIMDAVRWVPLNDKLIRPKFVNLPVKTDINYPTHKKPLGIISDYLDRLSLSLQIIDSSRLPAEKVNVNPASLHFPGIVDKSAKRISKSLEIDTTIPLWHSTGLYAPPGEVITVTSSGLSGHSLSVRIGCHADTLWNMDSWYRAPEITISKVIAASTTTIASAFGGLIYIEVPEDTTLGKVTINITGGIESPLFVLGKTTKDEWQNVEKHHLGPWSEIGSSKLIITVPTTAISKLDDPQSLMIFWDKVLDSYSDLLGIPHERLRPERIVPDEQIKMGGLHSGYPIMSHLDVADWSINLQRLLKEGSWGHFHEIGHNHQKKDWTFEGTVEVTNNIFVLYAFETVCGIDAKEAHPVHNLQEATIKQIYKKYNDSGRNFETWKSDPWLALISYYQLKSGFGWEPYKKIFREYSSLSESERPKNDADKRDQWMVRFSKIVGKNLGPFYQAWGVPTSEGARKSINNLPIWMPNGFL